MKNFKNLIILVFLFATSIMLYVSNLDLNAVASSGGGSAIAFCSTSCGAGGCAMNGFDVQACGSNTITCECVCSGYFLGGDGSSGSYFVEDEFTSTMACGEL